MPALNGPRESSLQATALAALRARGGWWQRKSGHSPYESSGVPDIYGCYRGRFVAFELKRPGARRGLTATQRIILDDIAQNDGTTGLITMLETAMSILDGIDEELDDD